MSNHDEEYSEEDAEAYLRELEEFELSDAGIAEQNASLLRRYRDFRLAADAVAAAWRSFSEVARIALIGSLARAPWKEVPRFKTYRRAGIELWHECKDVDLGLWITKRGNLNALRKAKVRALKQLHEKGGAGVVSHQVDVFLFDPDDRYLGRLCEFNQCPKGKPECAVKGCGATPFLQQHDDFEWRAEALADDRIHRLYDRASGQQARAADLPLPSEDEAERD